MSETIDSISSADLYQPVGRFKGVNYVASTDAIQVLESRGLDRHRMSRMNPAVLQKNIIASGLEFVIKGNDCVIDLPFLKSEDLRKTYAQIDYSCIDGHVSGYLSNAAVECLVKENHVRNNESGRVVLATPAGSAEEFSEQMKKTGLECKRAYEANTGRSVVIADKRTPLVSTRTTRVIRRRE